MVQDSTKGGGGGGGGGGGVPFHACDTARWHLWHIVHMHTDGISFARETKQSILKINSP